ncbi:MAG: hypothetical protein ACYSWZ_10025 [Planctomycetota bacterium]|jgi:hypothetical protein
MNWSQLRTIIWLRWRLTRNQWSRRGQLNAILTMIVVVLGLLIGIGGAIGGVLAGYFALAKASPTVMLGVWDVIVVAFLFFWMIGIITEIQRSEMIDISRMLHLPISLKDIFLVNFLASHLTLSIIVFLPGMLGLSMGLILGKSSSMICLFPLVLGFIFMITAWTYCLRGWLVSLMVNKRRRRAIIAGITFTFIILCQLPNLFGNLLRDNKRHGSNMTQSAPADQQTTTRPASPEKKSLPHVILVAHNYVPFLWVGNGAMSLAQDNVWPAVLGAAGAFGIGGLGLWRAYRTTLRFYQGRAVDKNITQKPKAEKVDAKRSNFLEKQLHGVPEEAAASALAFFRSLIRAPEVKMALATNVIMTVFIGAIIFVRRPGTLSENFKPFIALGAIAFMFLGMSQFMFNQFGFDRAGFRTLVLSPVPRRQILLGKNLAFLPFAGVIGLTLIVLVKFALRIPFIYVLAAGMQLVAAFLLLSILGNLLSVLVPYRIAPGSLKPTKSSTKTNFLIFVSRLLFPMAMVPIFFVPVLGLLFSSLGWLKAAPTNFFLSAVLLGLLVFFYRLSLVPLGELLQRREKQILQVVTKEVE